MYSNVHGTIGTICVVGTYKLTNNLTLSYTLGVTLGILSHDLFDRLNEFPYGGLKKTLLWELIPFLIFVSLAFLSDNTILYLIGWVSGNLMDLIDKKGGLSILFPDKYPATYLFKCHRRIPDINFTLNQTKTATIICSALVIANYILTN